MTSREQEENKNTAKLLAEKTAQEGTPVWQRCAVRSRGHLVVAPSVDYGGGGACFPEARHSYEKDETMRIDEVKRQLEAFGVLDGYREFATSSATVELAAAAPDANPDASPRRCRSRRLKGLLLLW